MRGLKHWFYKANLKTSGDPVRQDRQVVSEEEANLVSSEIEWSTYNGRPRHAPVLDIDMGCRVVESSTPGHYHLYIDKVMSWDEYAFLLRALYSVGIIQRGFFDMSLARGASFVRKPGVKKEPGDLNSGEVLF